MKLDLITKKMMFAAVLALSVGGEVFDSAVATEVGVINDSNTLIIESGAINEYETLAKYAKIGHKNSVKTIIKIL